MTYVANVLFDLDGTLIDGVPFICDSYAHTLACHERRSTRDPSSFTWSLACYFPRSRWPAPCDDRSIPCALTIRAGAGLPY